MAIRPLGLSRPPATGDASLNRWLQELRAAIDGLPLSIFSTTDGPNSSVVTAPVGFLGLEVGSSGTKFWLKEGRSATTGWVSVSTA